MSRDTGYNSDSTITLSTVLGPPLIWWLIAVPPVELFWRTARAFSVPVLQTGNGEPDDGESILKSWFGMATVVEF